MDLRTDILPHRDRLYRLALSITMDTAEAEDVVQDVMLRAWEKREEWERIDNMQAWLMQICKNLSLDRKKKNRFEDPSQLPISTFHSEMELDSHESISIVHQLIKELPPPLDDLIRLRDIEGLSYRDIATILHLSEDKVRVYLHRARIKLKDKYTKIQQFGL